MEDAEPQGVVEMEEEADTLPVGVRVVEPQEVVESLSEDDIVDVMHDEVDNEGDPALDADTHTVPHCDALPVLDAQGDADAQRDALAVRDGESVGEGQAESLPLPVADGEGRTERDEHNDVELDELWVREEDALGQLLGDEQPEDEGVVVGAALGLDEEVV